MDLSEDIFLGKLNRIPRRLLEAFCTGRSLRSCREALEAAGHRWKLSSGAMVFVHPWQYRLAERALQGHELHPDNIVFAQSIEYLVEECLSVAVGEVGRRTWVKSREPLDLPEYSEVATVGDFAEDADSTLADSFVTQRTFLCLAASRRPAAAVTQSTTEADSRKGVNPRRVVIPPEGC